MVFRSRVVNYEIEEHEKMIKRKISRNVKPQYSVCSYLFHENLFYAFSESFVKTVYTLFAFRDFSVQLYFLVSCSLVAFSLHYTQVFFKYRIFFYIWIISVVCIVPSRCKSRIVIIIFFINIDTENEYLTIVKAIYGWYLSYPTNNGNF